MHDHVVHNLNRVVVVTRSLESRGDELQLHVHFGCSSQLFLFHGQNEVTAAGACATSPPSPKPTPPVPLIWSTSMQFTRQLLFCFAGQSSPSPVKQFLIIHYMCRVCICRRAHIEYSPRQTTTLAIRLDAIAARLNSYVPRAHALISPLL